MKLRNYATLICDLARAETSNTRVRVEIGFKTWWYELNGARTPRAGKRGAFVPCDQHNGGDWQQELRDGPRHLEWERLVIPARGCHVADFYVQTPGARGRFEDESNVYVHFAEGLPVLASGGTSGLEWSIDALTGKFKRYVAAMLLAVAAIMAVPRCATVQLTPVAVVARRVPVRPAPTKPAMLRPMSPYERRVRGIQRRA